MEPTETFKTFGVMAAGLTLFSASYVLITADKIHRHRSISMHVADRRTTYLLFAITSTISAVLFGIFLLQWFVPALQLPWYFTALMLVGQTAQFIAAWVPHTKGLAAQIHSVMAYTMAITLLITAPLLLASPVLGTVPKVIISIITTYMAGSFASVFAVPRTKEQFLAYQSAFIACFFAAIFIATYSI